MRRKELIKFRIELGLKSKEMAEKLGITATKYSNIENGKVTPSMDFAYKFEEVFKVKNAMELFRKS